MAISAAVNILDGLATPVSRTFEIVKTLPNGNDRILNGSSVLAPTTLQIRHNSYPAKGSKASYDRRAVACLTTFMDSQGTPQIVSFSGSLIVPRVSTLTNQQMLDVSAFVRNFWAANMADLQLGKF